MFHHLPTSFLVTLAALTLLVALILIKVLEDARRNPQACGMDDPDADAPPVTNACFLRVEDVTARRLDSDNEVDLLVQTMQTRDTVLKVRVDRNTLRRALDTGYGPYGTATTSHTLSAKLIQ